MQSLCVFKKALHIISFLFSSDHEVILMTNGNFIILLIYIGHIFMFFNHCYNFYMLIFTKIALMEGLVFVLKELLRKHSHSRMGPGNAWRLFHIASPVSQAEMAFLMSSCGSLALTPSLIVIAVIYCIIFTCQTLD